MASSFRHGRLNLTAVLLLFLSLLNIATAAPLLNENVDKTLAARYRPDFEEDNRTPITKEQYMDYLKEYFPATDKYMEYTGFSGPQIKAFKEANPDYLFYDDFYGADGKPDHPYYKAFDPETQMDDGEASSEAISEVATSLLVFGGIEYQTEAAKKSFYRTNEADINLRRLGAGELKAINHMVKDATSPTKVLATENAAGQFTFSDGYAADTTNASPPAPYRRSPATPNTNRPGSQNRNNKPLRYPGEDDPRSGC